MFLTYVIIAIIIAAGFVVAVKDEWCYAPFKVNEDESTEDVTIVEQGGARIQKDEFVLFSLGAIFAGASISFVIWGLFYILAPFLIPTTDEYILEETTPVYALQDNYYVSLKGDAKTFSYLVKDELGFQAKLFSNKTVYFDYVENPQDACLETRVKPFTEGWWNVFVKPSMNHRAVDRIYVFKVPEGSLTQDYSVDLQ